MGLALAPAEIEARLPLWRAMSDLFLDTELQDFQYRHLANVVLESGFGPLEVHRIFWNEVFPALADNLRSVAGEWAMFPDDWLQKRIVNVLSGKESDLGSYGLIPVSETRAMIAESWAEACKYLPVEYKNAGRVTFHDDRPTSPD